MNDTELRRKLLELKDEQGNYVINSLGVSTPYPMQALLRFIANHSASVEREARIDELNIMVKTDKRLDDFSTSENPYSFDAQTHRTQRISELTNQEVEDGQE